MFLELTRDEMNLAVNAVKVPPDRNPDFKPKYNLGQLGWVEHDISWCEANSESDNSTLNVWHWSELWVEIPLMRQASEEYRLLINVVTRVEWMCIDSWAHRVMKHLTHLKPWSTLLSSYVLFSFRHYGFHHYLKDLFTCPDDIMKYLCKQYHVHTIPIGNNHTKEVVEQVMRDIPQMNTFYTEHHQYNIKRSRYSKETSSRCTELRLVLFMLWEVSSFQKSSRVWAVFWLWHPQYQLIFWLHVRSYRSLWFLIHAYFTPAKGRHIGYPLIQLSILGLQTHWVYLLTCRWWMNWLNVCRTSRPNSLILTPRQKSCIRACRTWRPGSMTAGTRRYVVGKYELKMTLICFVQMCSWELSE